MEFSRIKYRRPLGSVPVRTFSMKGTGSAGCPRFPQAEPGRLEHTARNDMRKRDARRIPDILKKYFRIFMVCSILYIAGNEQTAMETIMRKV
jgi:hypothetical protein